MQISQAQLDEVVAHAQEDAPNECCGYMKLRDGRVEEVVRATNEKNSPYAYELDPRSLYGAWKLSEYEGYDIAIYHSHPRSPAQPSQTDININLAAYPEWLQIIISLADEPDVRAWWIQSGKPEEEPITVA